MRTREDVSVKEPISSATIAGVIAVGAIVALILIRITLEKK